MTAGATTRLNNRTNGVPKKVSPHTSLHRKYAFDAHATAKKPSIGTNCRTMASSKKCVCHEVGNSRNLERMAMKMAKATYVLNSRGGIVLRKTAYTRQR